MSISLFKEADRRFLKKLGVQAVYLFGSRAQGKAGPLSDYDYAVLLKETKHSRGDKVYFQLYEFFSKFSPRSLKNDVIDIVFLRDIGLELRFHVIRYGKLLYEQDPKARANFEAETVLLYADYRPHLDRFDQAILEVL